MTETADDRIIKKGVPTRGELRGREGAELDASDLDAIGAVTAAINASAGMLALAGLVGALAERGAVEPMKVAAWIDTLANGFGADQPPAIRDGVKAQLASFTSMLRSMATPPANAGRG